MISADFYPTAIQFDAPSYVPTFHLTDTIRNCDANAFSAFYWLGWLSWDNLPDCWKLSEYVLTNTDLSFNIATPPQNVNIGFASLYDASQNSGTVKYPECYYDSPLVPVSQSYARYINKLDVMGVGNSGVRFGWHCSYIYGVGDSLTNRNYKDGVFAKSGKALYDFLYGDATETITLVTGITYELDFNNMDEDGSFHFTTTYNDTNYDFVISFSYCASLNMRNVSPSATAGTRNVDAYPMYSMTMDDNIYSFINTGSCFYLASGYPACIINKQTMQPNSTPSVGNIIGDYIANGLVCDIPKAFANSPAYSRLITGNAHVFNRGSDIAVYRMLTRSEMQKIVGLSLRQSDGTRNTYGYQNELSYAPYITENNEFTATLITGDLSDDEFKAKLRPWQYDEDEWEENDYTEDDLPPYEPGGGGDDNSETGDKIPNQFGRNVGVTSNFITQYLMTQGQISKLGEVLWTSWADDTVTMDMVENFYGKLHDATGSWNVSSALQFLVSCRMFPVSLATLVGTTATTSIPIGTGAFALQCGTSTEPTFFIANESVAVLNCGDVYVPKEFGDYRDFDNTNITAYLPYCGSVQLSPQDVVGKWLGCTYAIDLFDGSCKAFLYTLSGNDVGYEGAYYNVAIKEGQCGFLIPMSATQAGEVASRRKVDSYVDGSMLFNAGSTMLDGTMRIASGDGLGAIGADVGRLANLGFAYNTLSAQRMGRAGIAAPTIAGGSGFADFMQPASPYIQIRRSRYQMPIQYENSAAYPTNAQNYGNLSQFTGFVQCKNVDVKGFTCHEEERSAIKALLESGVYL